MRRSDVSLAEDEKIYEVTIRCWWVGEGEREVSDAVKEALGENFEDRLESIDVLEAD